jgi:hypothetical protein
MSAQQRVVYFASGSGVSSLKDDKLDSGVKEFNYYINKIVKRNYPKFSRLYALFI